MGGPGLIDGVRHQETDNFGRCTFRNEDGVVFHSGEQYFQWSKCVNEPDRQSVLKGGIGGDVWSVGRHVRLRPDWEVVKVRCMLEGNKLKFEQNPEFVQRLIGTRGRIRFGGAMYHVPDDDPEEIVDLPPDPRVDSRDPRNCGFSWSFWNARIMEYLRAVFRKNGTTDEVVSAQFEALMEEYEERQRVNSDRHETEGQEEVIEEG